MENTREEFEATVKHLNERDILLTRLEKFIKMRISVDASENVDCSALFAVLNILEGNYDVNSLITELNNKMAKESIPNVFRG